MSCGTFLRGELQVVGNIGGSSLTVAVWLLSSQQRFRPTAGQLRMDVDLHVFYSRAMAGPLWCGFEL